MRLVIAFVLLTHGVAHLVGFVTGWHLMKVPEVPYKTTIFAGHVDLGDGGIRVMGTLWLTAAALFVIAGLAVRAHAGWAYDFTGAAIAVSMLLCIVGWPEAKVGLGMNVLLAVLMMLIGRTGW